jgi:phosphatidylinositol alpha-mannosyltransferase
MKIVHLIATLGKGGAERVSVDLANQQARQGHEVAMVVGSKVDERLIRDELDPRIAFEYIHHGSGRIARYIAGVGWFFRRIGWLSSRDVVHAHLTFPAILATMLYAWRKMAWSHAPRIVETYHAVGLPIPRWHRWLHARMASRRDGLILMASDPYWDRFLAKHPQISARVIPNGLAEPKNRTRDEQVVRSYEEAAAIPSGKFVFGSVGRLVRARRPQSYIPIFARVAAAYGDEVHFLMAGEGGEHDAVAALAKVRGISDRLHLPGLAPDASLPRALIDLYITINVGPVTGLNGLEAAFAGLPVIAIQMVDDYHSGDDDWIWSSANLDAVADEAIRLIGDAESRAALATRQQAHVRTHHGVAVMAAAYGELYTLAGARAQAPEI